jgi:hypothetical protein
LTPTAVVGLDSGVVDLDAGFYHACAVLAEGQAECWGDAPSFGWSPLAILLDADLDGCADPQEEGANEHAGGERNPKSFWDFFDTPARDRRVTVGDIAAVVGRFGSSGDANVDPMSASPAAPAYHTAFDRTLVGADPWDSGPPNGSVSVQDITLVAAQFGHTCV